MALDVETRTRLEELLDGIDLDDYAARVVRGVAAMPEYRDFVGAGPEREDRGLAGIRLNLEIFLRWAPRGGALDRGDRAKLRSLIGARAAEGHPSEQGLAVYRRAVRAGWEVLREAADEDQRAALAAAFELPLTWLDLVAEIFAEVYAEAELGLIGQDERRARWLLERLVSAAASPDDRQLAELLGFRLASRYRPFAAGLSGASGLRHLQLAASLRRRGLLAVAEGARVVGLAREAPAWPALVADEALLSCELGEVAQPDLAAALTDLRLLFTRAASRGERGPIDPDRLLPELLLARSPDLAARLWQRVFGALSEAGRPDLVATLVVLAVHGFERGTTAAALPVHRNTLAQRSARIEQLTGLDLEDPADRALVWLAVRSEDLPEAEDRA